MQTPGLDGHAFRGENDVRIELLRASREADTSEHPAARNEYVLVLEGRYALTLGGGSIVLESGMEFAFPEGFQITGKIAAGTRLLRAVSSP
jgi:quercetin dioxygenase-like cupin family protein